MVDLWRIYGGFTEDLWVIYGGFIEYFWMIYGGNKKIYRRFVEDF